MRKRRAYLPKPLPKRRTDEAFHQDFLNTHTWKKTRLLWLKQMPYCEICAAQNRAEPPPIGNKSLFVDHIVPRSAEGAELNFGNFCTMCWLHHARKSKMESEKKIWVRTVEIDIELEGAIIAKKLIPADREEIIRIMSHDKKK